MSETAPQQPVGSPAPAVTPASPIKPRRKWYAYIVNLLILALALYGAWSLYGDYGQEEAASTNDSSVNATASSNETIDDTTSNANAATTTSNSSTSASQASSLTLYSSSNLDYEFYYPVGWTVTYTGNNAANGVKELRVTNPNGSVNGYILENDGGRGYESWDFTDSQNITTKDGYVVNRVIGTATVDGVTPYIYLMNMTTGPENKLISGNFSMNTLDTELVAQIDALIATLDLQ